MVVCAVRGALAILRGSVWCAGVDLKFFPYK